MADQICDNTTGSLTLVVPLPSCAHNYSEDVGLLPTQNTIHNTHPSCMYMHMYIQVITSEKKTPL